MSRFAGGSMTSGRDRRNRLRGKGISKTSGCGVGCPGNMPARMEGMRHTVKYFLLLCAFYFYITFA